ncbi:hypothetical protein FCIRC_1113 [Fusarium circinatum]|uniref:Uncharacterized protein n=1 Tax=Fusarium circinatum TaxID=48490 RepID=A0A8H5UGA1_FUSCI|nr:hypothetical protein FCIRC_1113 [Fusarium circinatum]
MTKIPSDLTEQELIDMAQNEVDRRGGWTVSLLILLEALFWGDKEVKYEDIPEELKAYEEKDGDKDKKLEEDKAKPAEKHDDGNK